MPIARYCIAWSRLQWAKGSPTLKAALAVGLALGACLYLVTGLWFDLAYWLLGRFAADRVGGKARVAASAVVAVLVFGALGAAGSAPKATPTLDSAAQLVDRPLASLAAPSPSAESVRATPTPSPSPTVAPSPSPSPSPTAEPTPSPSPTPALPVKITSLPAKVVHGRSLSITAVTTKGAVCYIVVELPSGAMSDSKGLDSQRTANSKGAVSWSWTVGANTTPGTATATVFCNLGDRSGSASKTFKVT